MPEIPTQPAQITADIFYRELIALKNEISDLERRVLTRLDRLIETGTPVVTQQIANLKTDCDEVRQDIDEHDKRLKELETLAPALRVFIWVAGALGVSIVGLIWALITGAASIVFR